MKSLKDFESEGTYLALGSSKGKGEIFLLKQQLILYLSIIFVVLGRFCGCSGRTDRFKIRRFRKHSQKSSRPLRRHRNEITSFIWWPDGGGLSGRRYLQR